MKNTNKMLSARSKRPPCPGKMIPESFKLVFLLRKEINKSPIIEKIVINKPNIIKVTGLWDE